MILAEVAASTLQEADIQQKDMVIDFGFLKDVMIRKIHDPCDHGMILDRNDPLQVVLAPLLAGASLKVLWVDFIPTAEKLAEYWFNEMYEDVKSISNNLARLVSVEVFETPNCTAYYYPANKVALPQ